MTRRAPRLFLGMGNILHRDDGLGVWASKRVARWPLPSTVEICDGGTSGLDLVSVIERRERVVVIEAIEARAEPGAIFRLTAEQLKPFVRSGLSLHEAHWLDALNETILMGTSPKRLVIFAVQVEDVSLGMGLSASVEKVMERVIELAASELAVTLKGIHPLAVTVST